MLTFFPAMIRIREANSTLRIKLQFFIIKNKYFGHFLAFVCKIIVVTVSNESWLN